MIYIPDAINKNIDDETGNIDSTGRILMDDYDGSFIGSKKTPINWNILYYGNPPGSASLEKSWSPSFGWYLILVAFILSIISMIITLFKIDYIKEEMNIT